MLFEKRMIHKLLDSRSIIWILLKTAVQKVSYLVADKQIRRNFDLVFNYFD